MRTHFSTIMPTSSCGLVTTITPSTGSDWNTVSGTSPVPGGISTNMKSTSPHITSVQNCVDHAGDDRAAPDDRIGFVFQEAG